MPDKLNVGIVGCGIGGLAAAILLRNAGHKVSVFERFSKPSPVGSGLVIQPVGRQVLAEIGVEALALELGTRIDRLVGHDAISRRVVLDVAYGHRNPDQFGIGIHRASLFDILFKEALKKDVEIETDAQVLGVCTSFGWRIRLDGDRIRGPFDLIVDASGTDSVLRPQFGKLLNYGAIWGNIDWPQDLPYSQNELRQRYVGAHHMLGILPIGRLPGSGPQKAAIFWSIPQKGYEQWRHTPLKDWKAEAHEIWPEFSLCLSQINSHDQMVMANYRHGTMRRPVKGNLIHIGDAAHMASPQLGQGANLALLDAQALTRAISHTSSLDQGLAIYAKARRWHVKIYQTISAVFTPMYQSDSKLLPILRDRVMMPLSRIPPAPGILASLVSGNLVQPYAGLNTKSPGAKAPGLRNSQS